MLQGDQMMIDALFETSVSDVLDDFVTDQRLKDALFGQWLDSDFGNGSTDADGWVLKAGYAPVRNFTMNATYCGCRTCIPM